MTQGARRWWADGALSRPGARWRYATVLVVVAVLAGLPALVGAIPVDAKRESMASLLARIRASDTVAYSGLASSSGRLNIPDLGTGHDVIDLLSRTNRLRAWVAGPAHYRVDRVTFGAESDIYRDGRGVWTWDSDRRIAQFTVSAPQVPLPGPQDALPANLARRLLEQASAKDVAPVAARRIAGRTALGLIWHPKDKKSLVGQVNVWADQATGLPLAVDVREVGSTGRAFSTSFLELSLKAPSKARLTFDPSHDPTATVENSEGVANDIGLARFELPPTLAGLPLRSQMKPLVGTYGRGVALVAVSDLGDPQSAMAIRAQIDSPSRPPILGKFGQGSLIQAPLLTGLVFATQDSGYFLLGTVTRDQIEAMALDLVLHPPKQVGVAQPIRHGP